jgi:hypothetical protein
MFTAGALDGEAASATPPRQSSFHALLGPRVGVDVPLFSVIALDAHVEGAYALTTTSLRVNEKVLWTTSPLAGLAAIGIVALIP